MNKVRIEIDTKTFIRFWLVVIGFVLAGAMLWTAKDALILVGMAAFLALALNDPVSKITKILPGSKKNRVGATAVAFLLIVGAIGIFVRFVLPVVISQTGNFISSVPDIVHNVTAENSALRQFVQQNNLENAILEVSKNLGESFESAVKNFASFFVGGINAIVGVIFSLFLVLSMSFFMLIEGPGWISKIWSLYPDKSRMKRHRRVASRMYRAVSGFINGQLIVSAIGGVATSLGVMILSLTMGVPADLIVPVGVILFFLNLIPMFGVIIGVALSSLLVLFSSVPAGLIFVVYCVVYQQIESNVIVPMIQARTNQLSALIVIVAITIGVYVLGIFGALISIPIAACVKILVEEYFRSRSKKEAVADISDIVEKL